MLIRREFPWTRFTPDVIRRARVVFDGLIPPGIREPLDFTGDVTVNAAETWALDDEEDFYEAYRLEPLNARAEWRHGRLASLEILHLPLPNSATQIAVRLADRHSVERVFETFETARAACAIAPPPHRPPGIAFGHGGSAQWRDLADHLRDGHGYPVEAFETSPRAGMSIKEVLEELIEQNAFAVLVHTAEDEQGDGGLRARQNVVHETGLFQHAFGWRRAIIVREDGCAPFSNVTGIVEIRYGAGNIREAFGEVAATIRREFGTT